MAQLKNRLHGKRFFYATSLKDQTEKLVPQPQVLLALGLLKVKPRLSSPSCQSTSMPNK
jgi:hypothetical protein